MFKSEIMIDKAVVYQQLGNEFMLKKIYFDIMIHFGHLNYLLLKEVTASIMKTEPQYYTLLTRYRNVFTSAVCWFFTTNYKCV